MKYCFLILLGVVLSFNFIDASSCGCKKLRQCYSDMLTALKMPGESACIEDASIGTGSVMIFLRALQQFCGNVINVTDSLTTYEGRHLYEVVLHATKENATTEDDVPVILIDAGQQADMETVEFALYIIEQLMACQENDEMISKVKWVILPSTNPDGQEYARFHRTSWSKNMKMSKDQMSFGVDISRNFADQWSSCVTVTSGFSSIYPGPAAASETETKFIQNSLKDNHPNAYLSFRKNGHGIYYPCAFSDDNCDKGEVYSKTASAIASKVNARAKSIQVFSNSNIYKGNGKPHCGHSVDYAKSLNIPLVFEMRMFLGTDNVILSRFQNVPKGYVNTLRTGYWAGIREVFTHLTKDESVKTMKPQPKNEPKRMKYFKY